MSENLLKELNIEELRKRFLKYTRKAFQMLPKMDKPHILDIGCGTGIPTIELARLSNGVIIGIDIDQDALDKLNLKIKKKGLSSRVKIINCSLYKTEFLDENFDIIWDEGVIHILDLKKSLKECSRLLRPNGFLVIGEMIEWIKDKFEIFSQFGFKLINQFLLPEKCWWTDYYKPLEKRIKELRKKYQRSEYFGKLTQHEREIKMVKKNPKKFDCGFYIMQKIN
ncbi:MAG: class I SAM-dependent methyltransferase [Promethearchaeota archaeon]